ncbi:MAG: amidohydrolase family protein, partial [Flavobacteriales bacterium]|nr:amidohydrolase family protein [Flavobacteriales bacterium]
MGQTIIKGAQIVNEGKIEARDLLLKDGRILQIAAPGGLDDQSGDIVDGSGKHVLPGLIDDQVHFREPGLTHKADIGTESRAAVAGGITSFMEMPNTVPQALTQQLLQDKYDIAAESSVANYSFFMGASNHNLEEVLKTDARTVCGVKVFMGSSTGDMLVDDRKVLDGIFSECPSLIATHCEDEATVRANLAKYVERFGDAIPIDKHPIIRSAEACYKSSSMASELATRYN